MERCPRAEFSYAARSPQIGFLVTSLVATVGGLVVAVSFGDVVIPLFALFECKLSWFSWLFTVVGGIGTTFAAIEYRDKWRAARGGTSRKLSLEARGNTLVVDDSAGDGRGDARPGRDFDMTGILKIWFEENEGKLYYVSTDAMAASCHYGKGVESRPFAFELDLFSANASLEQRRLICPKAIDFIQRNFPGVETSPPSTFMR
jgi:hypothetical protein